mgnify:CR=1 FL=1
MPFQNDILGGASGQDGGYFIENSLRFNVADTPRLVRTPTATGDEQKMTWSVWIKKDLPLNVDSKKLVHIKDWDLRLFLPKQRNL